MTNCAMNMNQVSEGSMSSEWKIFTVSWSTQVLGCAPYKRAMLYKVRNYSSDENHVFFIVEDYGSPIDESHWTHDTLTSPLFHVYIFDIFFDIGIDVHWWLAIDIDIRYLFFLHHFFMPVRHWTKPVMNEIKCFNWIRLPQQRKLRSGSEMKIPLCGCLHSTSACLYLCC